MNEINIEVPEGYVLDEENSSFTCIKFKKEEKKQVTCWEDLKFISGYYITDESGINYCTNKCTEPRNMNMFATKEQAEACIALAMLSQLMKNVNGDWIPDWKNDSYKYMLSFSIDGIVKDDFYHIQKFLTFPTKEIRDNFMKNHEKLIMKAKPLL